MGATPEQPQELADEEYDDSEPLEPEDEQPAVLRTLRAVGLASLVVLGSAAILLWMD